MSTRCLMGISVLIVLTLGCDSNQRQIETKYTLPSQLGGVWTVEQVGLELGHWTAEGSQADHLYVFAAKCKQGTETISLLYQDRLPNGLNLSAGERIKVMPTPEASFDTAYGGFWITDLSIESTDSL